MKSRKCIKNNNGKYDIVWFGSRGIDPITGNKIPAENYSTEQEGVRDSLVQRLSVLKGELWYKMSYGLPLFDKIRDKGIYDAVVLNIVQSHPDVKTVVDFKSSIKENYQYSVSFILTTIYTEEESTFDFAFNN